ncbi:hypothetical protein JZ751_007912 [Albula glossodonta]|uniref:Uncharacterized protein n=1 Tax=Albula glossodonta TaxID=121402 RepID=A0A8T2P0Z9_9TELE|nr:hypothetical protein JZ751_007912 [Albula glossodonta]
MRLSGKSPLPEAPAAQCNILVQTKSGYTSALTVVVAGLLMIPAVRPGKEGSIHAIQSHEMDYFKRLLPPPYGAKSSMMQSKEREVERERERELTANVGEDYQPKGFDGGWARRALGAPMHLRGHRIR